MARDLSGMADPDDTRWKDQGRDVGDGEGAPRVKSGCRREAAFVALAVGSAAVLGLTAAVGLAYLAVAP